MAEFQSDEEIREQLSDLHENPEVTLTSWEAGFIEDMCESTLPLTERQRDKAEQIIEDRSPTPQ